MTDLENGYTLSANKTLLQTEIIHEYLSNESYWAKGIALTTVIKSIENSYCVGIYYKGQQVAFARLITDYATFGYLADVFVLPGHRKKGLSKEIMKYLLGLDWVCNLRNIMLGTQDAQSLYERFGFKTQTTGRYMSRFRNF